MKTSLYKLRCFIRAILIEAICPVCGGRGAYVGLRDVECPNKACPKFSQNQLDAEPAGISAGSMPLKGLDLDWAGESLDDFEPFCQRHGISGEIVDMNGPAGGNPVVRIVGPEDKLRKAVEEYDGGNEGADFYMDNAEDKTEMLPNNIR